MIVVVVSSYCRGVTDIPFHSGCCEYVPPWSHSSPVSAAETGILSRRAETSHNNHYESHVAENKFRARVTGQYTTGCDVIGDISEDDQRDRHRTSTLPSAAGVALLTGIDPALL